MRNTTEFAILAAGFLLAACAGERTAESDQGYAAPAASTPAAAPSSPGAPGSNPASSQLIALGDSIFHGRAAGGTCMSCHGQNGGGGPIGPNLTDAEWLHGDGSYNFIVMTVTNGVPSPKKFPGMMPPKGGAPLTTDQVQAVGAYVYSLGRPGG